MKRKGQAHNRIFAGFKSEKGRGRFEKTVSELDGAHWRQELSGGEVGEELEGEKKGESWTKDLGADSKESKSSGNEKGKSPNDLAELDGSEIEQAGVRRSTGRTGMG